MVYAFMQNEMLQDTAKQDGKTAPMGSEKTDPRLLPAADAAAKTPIHQHVYERLRKMILFGDLAPGQGVTIQGLTAALDAGMTPVREAIRRLIALQSTPQYLVEALYALHKTVDSIWRAADDKSTDFNFYTKRGLLAGIYCSTTLFWLNDYSTGSTETWHFLDQRIGDVMNLQKIRVNIEEKLKRLEPRIAKFFQMHAPRT